MAREDTAIFCERCGAVVPLSERNAQAHYCPGCRTFTCPGCWDADAIRCVDCAQVSSSSGSNRGILAARRIHRDLAGVHPGLKALASGAQREVSAQETVLQQRLLTIRSRDAAAAGLAALVDAHGIAADTLRREIELERLRVLASAPQADRGRRLRIPALFPSIAGLRTRLPAGASRQALGFIGMAAAVAVVVGLAVMIGGRGLRTTEPGPAGVAGASATPEQALAGGRSSSAALPSRSPTASVPALVPVRATFDDLVMGEPLAAVWQLTGSAGSAEVAPFPNAVDRSLRVTTSRDGTQTTICRPVSAGHAPARLSVDLFAEALAGLEMSIRTPDPSQQLAAVVDGSGSMMVNPGAMPLVQASLRDARWITLTVEIDPDGTTVGASIDGTSARGTATLPAPLYWTTASLCLRSPSAPAASLYVDNLVVE